MSRRTAAWRAAAAGAAVLAATGAARLAALNPLTAAFVYLVVVLLAAARGGLAAGVAASLAATACLNFFFLPPVGAFHLDDPQNWVALAAFLTAAVLTSRLVTQARAQAERAAARQRRVEAMAVERERLLRETAHIDALRESEELKTALLRAVSHDLSTPLTAISFQVDALKRQVEGEEARARLADLALEVSRLRRRIEDLLALGRLEAGTVAPRPEPVPAADLFRAARESLSLLSRPLRVAVDADCPDVFVDPSLALEIVVNLVENADRASAEGVPVELVASRSDGDVRLGVLDRGHGIVAGGPHPEGTAAEVLPRGLGLEIARRFAAASGGSVRLEPRSGGGVAAWVLLPAAAEAAP